MRENRKVLALGVVLLTIHPHKSLFLSPSRLSDLRAQQEVTSPAPPFVTCSAEKPAVWPRQVIALKAWAATTGPSLQYSWEATAGRIDSGGQDAQWDFTGVQPGSYTATVKVNSARNSSASCSVQVIVQKREGERGPLETGRSFLVGSEPEVQGYGLYSYLLFGSPPDDTSRERYTKAVEAYLLLIPDIKSLEKYLQPRELNVTYLPVDDTPPTTVLAGWVLEHYNYARGRALLRTLPGNHRDGPYIVSVLKPLSGTSSLAGQYLYQDLSSVPPQLASAWVKEFLNQAAQERFWEASSAEELVLKMRTTIGILAMGLPDVRKGLDQWIAWTR